MRKSCFAAALAALLAPGAVPALAAPGPALTVDVGADRHAISPDIYGMNDNPWDPTLGKEISLPVSRWGGDATTRYNWSVDASNSGGDWYFMAGGGKSGPVVPGASADAFVSKIKSVGGKALLTIPVIDYINSIPDNQWNCSFPVSIVGPQQKVNPYVHPTVNGQRTDAGNGMTSDGKPIRLTTDQILRDHVPNTPEIQQAWLRHLIGKFGTAAHGGVAIYEMDNEPGGWDNTHRDVHPDKPTYPEIVDKTLPYAQMIKGTDPTALIDGPGDFGWAAYRGDTSKTGPTDGVWNAPYYLARFAEASHQAGHRLLDYFDEHYYPTGQTGEDAAARLQATRSLWDPTYVEKDWIGQYYGAIELIPRMHQWVDQNYPGTKLAISEYNWHFGPTNTIMDALTEADVLGIFGRERLDMATMWGPPKVNDPVAYAFRIYRNYDGQGGKYGSVWVQSASADQGQLAVYGAVRQSDGALTLVVINKTAGDLSSALALSHFAAVPTAQVYRYDGDNLQAIVRQPDQTVGADGFTATYPAYSVTLVVVGRRG